MSAILTVQGIATTLTVVATIAPVKPNILPGQGFVVAKKAASSSSPFGNLIEIQGERFGTEKQSVQVSFTPGMQMEQIWYLSDTLMVVDVGDTNSIGSGSLAAQITHTVTGSSSSTSIGTIESSGQVPHVNDAVEEIYSSENEITLSGSNFGSTASNIRIYFVSAAGLSPLGSVKNLVSATSMVVNINGLSNSNVGRLETIVSVKGTPAASRSQVGTVFLSVPRLNPAHYAISRHSSGARFMMHGSGFGTDQAAVSVSFTPQLTSVSVVNCVDTMLVVDVGDTSSSLLSGDVSAVVTLAGLASDSVVVCSFVDSPAQLPTISTNTTSLGPGAPILQLLIAGTGFSSLLSVMQVYLSPSNSSMIFPTILNSSPSQLSIGINGLSKWNAGALTAVVSVSGVKTALTQVAVVSHNPPQITASTQSIAKTSGANRIHIHGTLFECRNQVIVFLPHVESSRYSCSDSLLVVDVSGTNDLAVGPISLVVTVSGRGSSDMTQIGTIVASVTAPTITQNLGHVDANAVSMNVLGTGFVAPAQVWLEGSGFKMQASVSSVSSTQISVSYVGISDINAGPISATVTINCIAVTQLIGTIRAVSPLITKSNFLVARSNAGNRIEITGTRFGAGGCSGLSVHLTPFIAITSYVNCTDSLLIIDIGSTSASSLRPTLFANISRSSFGSSVTAPIALLVHGVPAPLVQASTSNLTSIAPELHILVTGFDNLAIPRVYLRASNVFGISSTVISTSTTGVLIRIHHLPPHYTGDLHATVSMNGVVSSEVQVATIIDTSPVVTTAARRVAKSGSGNRIEIKGQNFGNVAQNIALIFVPSLSQYSVLACDSTRILVEISDTSGLTIGDLKVSVTRHGLGSSISVTVAQVVASSAAPTVGASTNSLNSSQTAVTILGSNFMSNAADDYAKVYLYSSTNTEIITNILSLTANQIVVSLTNLHAHLGNLYAVVAIQGVCSARTQIGTVVSSAPQVFSGANHLARNQGGNVLDIYGREFQSDCLTAVSVTLQPSLGVSVGTFPACALVQCTDSRLVISMGDTTNVPGGHFCAIVTHAVKGSSACIEIGIVRGPQDAPSINTSSAILTSNAGTVQIAGTNFGYTPSAVIVRLLTSIGTEISTSSLSLLRSNQINVAFSRIFSNEEAGALFAEVYVQGIKAGPSQIAYVASVQPGVNMTSGTAFTLAKSAIGNRIEIHGLRFGTDKSKIKVEFTPPIYGTDYATAPISVTSCTDKVLVVDTGSTSSLATGTLYASVRHSQFGSSGLATSIGSIVSAVAVPQLTESSSDLMSDASQITLNGQNFGSNFAQVRVYVSQGIVGTVLSTGFSDTQLQLHLTRVATVAGPIDAVLVTQGVKSPRVTIAIVVRNTPSVSAANFQVIRSSGGNRIEMRGSLFGTNAADISVVFDPAFSVGNGGNPVICKDNLLVFDVADTSALAASSLSAEKSAIYVTVSRVAYGNSGVPVKIGQLVLMSSTAPVLDANTNDFKASSTILTLTGSGFDSVLSNIRIYLSGGIQAQVTSADSRLITCMLSGLTDSHSGSITAIVAIQGVRTQEVQVANIIPDAPIIAPLCVEFDSSNTASTCDQNGDGTFSEACSLDTLCNVGVGTNGGCGTAGKCSGTQTSIARSASGNTLELFGLRFGSSCDKLSIEFSPLITGYLVHCSDSRLLVSTTQTSSTAIGALQAKVVRDNYVSSATATLGNIIAASSVPILNPSSAGWNWAADSPSNSLTLTGNHFGSAFTDVQVLLPDGLYALISVVQPTSITMKIRGISDRYVGALLAEVVVNGISTGHKQVTKVLAVSPQIVQDAMTISQAASSQILIKGKRFGSTCSALTVVFTPTVAVTGGNPAHCTDSLLVVNVGDTRSSLLLGRLVATVTKVSAGTSNQAQVANIVPSYPEPSLDSSALLLSSNQKSVFVTGQNLGDSTQDIWFVMSTPGGPALTADIASVTTGGKQVEISIGGLTDANVGALQCTAYVKGVATTSTQVAVVSAVAPVLGAVCIKYDSTNSATACDTNGDGTYSEQCALRVLCSAGSGVNGGCGTAGLCSGASVNVAKSAPGNRIDIVGSRFGSDPSQLAVAFQPLGSGKVISCTDSLIVAETSSSASASIGTLSAVVTSQFGSSPLTAIGSVENAVIDPAITASQAAIGSTASSIVITGNHFGTSYNNIQVYLYSQIGHVETELVGSPSDTQVTVSFNAVSNAHAGVLQAVVAVQGVKSALTQISTIQATLPSIQHAEENIARFVNGNRIPITGVHFGTACNKLAVAFTPALSSPTVVACTDSSLVVDVADTNALAGADLLATVTHTDYPLKPSSQIKVGSITTVPVNIPVITQSAEMILSNANLLTIQGSNFGYSIQNLHVYLIPAQGSIPIATTSSTFSTSCSIQPSSLNDDHVGIISAVVAVAGIKSIAVQIATIAAVAPFIGSTCERVSSDASSKCDVSGVNLYNQGCATDSLCDPSDSGCGSTGNCAGNTFKVAQSSTGNLIEIRGLRFGTNPNQLHIRFNPAPAYVSIASCRDSLIFVNIGDTTGIPTGPISATITHSLSGTGSATQIGQVVSPIQLPLIDSILNVFNSSSTQLDIHGANFGSDCNNLRVFLHSDSGLSVSGLVSCSSPGVSTSVIRVKLTSLTNQHKGRLQAQLVLQGLQSSFVTVANVVPVIPEVTATAMAEIGKSAAGNRIEIHGTYFGNVLSSIAISFSPSVGSVSVISCTNTVLLVDVGDTSSVVGLLSANITHTLHGSSGIPVPIGLLQPGIAVPVITASNIALVGRSFMSFDDLDLYGSGFGSSPSDIQVYVTSSAGPQGGISGTLLSLINPHKMKIRLQGLTKDNAGAVNVMVTVKTIKSAVVQVGTVVDMVPVVTAASFALKASGSGNRMEVAGTNFGTDPRQLTISTTPMMTTSIVSCTDTTITLDIEDTSVVPAGDVTAQVNHAVYGSSAAVIVGAFTSGTITIPAISLSSSDFASSQTSLTIAGSNFDPGKRQQWVSACSECSILIFCPFEHMQLSHCLVFP